MDFKIDQATKDAGGCVLAPLLQKFGVSVIETSSRKRTVNVRPLTDEKQRNGRKGKLARTKARNLLERLRTFESDIFRFMVDSDAPFTNNLVERDLRMTKVQQKISVCFRSWDEAERDA